jgi:hypothetical protein
VLYLRVVSGIRVRRGTKRTDQVRSQPTLLPYGVRTRGRIYSAHVSYTRLSGSSGE